LGVNLASVGVPDGRIGLKSSRIFIELGRHGFDQGSKTPDETTRVYACGVGSVQRTDRTLYFHAVCKLRSAEHESIGCFPPPSGRVLYALSQSFKLSGVGGNVQQTIFDDRIVELMFGGDLDHLINGFEHSSLKFEGRLSTSALSV